MRKCRCVFTASLVAVDIKLTQCFSFYSMLVNIYGSKDLFVSEYRTLLADRILSTFNYDTEREVSV